MNSKIVSVQRSAESIRAILPSPPGNAQRQLIYRAIQLLRFRDRWRYVPYALVVGAFGLACLCTGILMYSDLLTVTAFIGLFGAVYLALRLAPAQWEAQVVQAERDADKVQCDYSAQCQALAANFVTERRSALQAAATAAVQEGISLVQLHADLVALEQSLQEIDASLLNDLNQQRVLVGQRREEYQRQRARLAAVSKQWRAHFFPSLGRGFAREVLEALLKVDDAAGEEVRLQAAANAIEGLAEAAATLSRRAADTVNPVNIGDNDQPGNEGLPYWLGLPLPPADMVQGDAIRRAEEHLLPIREAVVAATAENQSAEDAFNQAVDKLFIQDQPWPTTIEAYLARLNGETSFFADRVCKDAAEWAPSNPIPGRDRHRKLFVLTAKGPNAAACRALRERLPDAVSVVGIEHLDEEVLVITEERNLVLAELPEAQVCLKAFRALPREQQAVLVTATAPEDIIDYYPDLAEDQGLPARLLASALSLGIVTRSGSQEYNFAGDTFAKGYHPAVQTLRLDKRLANRLQAKVGEAVASDGSAAIVAKLSAAQTQATGLVPKDVVREFKASLKEAIAMLNRRTAATTGTA